MGAGECRQPCGALVFIYNVACEGLSNDDIVVAGGTVVQETRPGAGFKTGIFVKEKLGGRATVERLLVSDSVCVKKSKAPWRRIS